MRTSAETNHRTIQPAAPRTQRSTQACGECGKRAWPAQLQPSRMHCARPSASHRPCPPGWPCQVQVAGTRPTNHFKRAHAPGQQWQLSLIERDWSLPVGHESTAGRLRQAEEAVLGHGPAHNAGGVLDNRPRTGRQQAENKPDREHGVLSKNYRSLRENRPCCGPQNSPTTGPTTEAVVGLFWPTAGFEQVDNTLRTALLPVVGLLSNYSNFAKPPE